MSTILKLQNYKTRQSYKLHVPKMKLISVTRTIKYRGVSIWNLLSDKVDYKCSLITYKYRMKSYLLTLNIET